MTPIAPPTSHAAATHRAILYRVLILSGLLLLLAALVWIRRDQHDATAASQPSASIESDAPSPVPVNHASLSSRATHPPATITPTVEAPQVAPLAATPTAEPTPVTLPASIVRLVIPSIGVDAAIEVTGVDPNGVMQPPQSPLNVGWYDFSADPGMAGNAIFAGHVDDADIGPAVFWHLGELQAGDLISVQRADGTVTEFTVTTLQSYPATTDASAIVAPTDTPTITLITCGGTFDPSARRYDERLVVTAELTPGSLTD